MIEILDRVLLGPGGPIYLGLKFDQNIRFAHKFWLWGRGSWFTS